ncbi:hypothetical protein I553_0446 [Mycobacterium xenopi 4042]|uniref:Uncharacterized protein n=1 Tax=Mycobacterium xenopi 4042 TaxID=1299334 RepID=X7YHK5_MYCXE|nr:hypothetical protein I553_0446 [Mycobacterium xenopi 4042]
MRAGYAVKLVVFVVVTPSRISFSKWWKRLMPGWPRSR